MPADEPPRTSRWVETGLLSPACGPRLGQSLSGAVFMSPPCPRGRAVALGAPSVGACRVSLGGGGGLPVSLHSPPPAAGGWWVGWPVACVLDPKGNPPHGPLERWRAPRSRGALAGQPRAP